jgi:acetoacetyl-CoA synthetase
MQHVATMAEPPILWKPDPEQLARTNIGRFRAWLEADRGHIFPDYDALWQWSVTDIESFWAAIWEFLDVRASAPYQQVVTSRELPGARWFEGARLNYAEHALRRADRSQNDAPAIIARSQSRPARDLSWSALRDEVARARAGLHRLGVGPGDRVAAYLPNIPETVVAFLATASLGAIWTSCAPEFGVRAVLDRFSQVEPRVLLAVDGYRYGAREIDRRDELAEIRASLPLLDAVVLVPYLDAEATIAGTVPWNELIAEPGELRFAQMPSDHPLYVLYSSGTTGLPKPIVHGHGGILLEHLKTLALHADLGPADRFFWFTTTGWMMWNYLVSGLLVGATVVLFDGDPAHPSLETLWDLAAETGVTWFGASAPFLLANRTAGLRPGRDFDLKAVRAVGSTGAPLPAEGFRYVYDEVGGDVLLSSISGGTDVCSAFVGGCPMVPVWEGEISCRYLGAAVASFDESGEPMIGAQGELVVTSPMPSMPVGFWGDHDGSRYRAAYFERFPGVWHHGDWITITDRGSCTITGRSDATLNRGGVRIGTSEIYRVVEAIDAVADSLIVHLEDAGGGAGTLVLFVVPADGSSSLDPALAATIRGELRSGLSPRHVPDEIHVLRAIPTTLSGKKLEVPVKRILGGADPADVASRGALKDPGSLDEVAFVARARATRGG